MSVFRPSGAAAHPNMDGIQPPAEGCFAYRPELNSGMDFQSKPEGAKPGSLHFSCSTDDTTSYPEPQKEPVLESIPAAGEEERLRSSSAVSSHQRLKA